MTKTPKHGGHHGAKIGPRIADLTVRAMNQHLKATGHHRAKIAAAGGVEFFKTITAESKAHAGHIFRALADHPDLHPEAAPLMAFLAHGEGELQALLSTASLSSGLQTSIGGAIANMLAPLNQDLISKSPFSLVPIGGAIEMAHRGIVSEEWARNEAAKQGINANRFKYLSNLAVQYPDPSMVLDMVNRGDLPEEDALDILRRHGFAEWLRPVILAERRTLLDPSDLALMTLRGILTKEEGRAKAAKRGLHAADFDLMTESTGEPPADMMLLEAYRRGFIDKPRLERGIRQSRVRNEWIDVVERLRYSPASTSDAVRAVVQNQLSDSEGQKIAQQNGLEPDHWDWLVKTEGNPLAFGQMLELYNRGEATEAQVKQAIREGRTKNKYVDLAVKLGRRLPPERTVVSMIGHGVIDHERGVHLLRSLGFDAQSSKELVAQGTSSKTAKDKDLAKADVLALYHEHAIDSARATKMLKALGYAADESSWLLKLQDLRRETAWRNQAVTVIRSAVLARHISMDQARADLQGAGLPADQISHLVKLWTLELSAMRRTLTEPQILHAVKKGLMDPETASGRLVGMGYSVDDAHLLIAGI